MFKNMKFYKINQKLIPKNSYIIYLYYMYSPRQGIINKGQEKSEELNNSIKYINKLCKRKELKSQSFLLFRKKRRLLCNLLIQENFKMKKSANSNDFYKDFYIGGKQCRYLISVRKNHLSRKLIPVDLFLILPELNITKESDFLKKLQEIDLSLYLIIKDKVTYFTI